MIKITNKHFELFKKVCKQTIATLGLNGWRVEYLFTKLKEDRAQCRTNYSGRVATLVLGKEEPNVCATDTPIASMVIQSAKHECLELLLSPLHAHAQDRTWDEREWEKDVHIIIRTLEKLI